MVMLLYQHPHLIVIQIPIAKWYVLLLGLASHAAEPLCTVKTVRRCMRTVPELSQVI